MRKLRNIFRVGLFITGITFQFASFYVSQVEQVACVLNIVSPKFVGGMAGVRSIEAGESLDQNDEGFQEVSTVIMAQIRKLNPSQTEVVNKLDIEKLKPASSSKVDFFGALTVNKVDVQHLLSDGREGVVTNTDYLRKLFEETRKASIFYWSLGLLIVGVGIVQIPLFFIQSS